MPVNNQSTNQPIDPTSNSQVPVNPSQVPSYINSLVDSKFQDLSASGNPLTDEANQTDQQIATATTNALTPTTPAPTLINSTVQYDTLSKQFNLDTINKQVNDLQSAIDAETANTLKGTQLEESKPVALNVISGRVDERQRIQNDKISTLNLQLSSLQRYQTSANNIIALRMSLSQQDFQNEKAAYQDEFNNNLQIYNTIQTKEAQRDDLAYKIQQDNKAAASANLTSYVNLITSGNIDYSSLVPAQKTEIGQLEATAGLPPGFIASIKPAPGANIKSITTRNVGGQQYADVISIDANGQPVVDSRYIGQVDQTATKASTTDLSEAKQADLGALGTSLDKVKGTDGYVSPGDFRKYMDIWTEAGYSRSDFLDQFSGAVNPEYYTDSNYKGDNYGLTPEEAKKYIDNIKI